ncbi:adenylate kinase 5 chloroplastic [Phtheirospermum japonicum]|uniref:adenylate kinase n=1 Tax=Phtheirospermum japonicum TaxID=374723 RepID=A0A830CWX0_9LAMI|nr:adenylate kinase 5 chloroplastic [Phtheirospermum japonicum]
MLIYSPIAAHCCNLPLNPKLAPVSIPSISPPSPSLYSSSPFPLSSHSHHLYGHGDIKTKPARKVLQIVSAKREPLKVMISGAPASGKGTQCEMIVQKLGVVHISTGDILRAEISAGTEIGKKAKEYMNNGRLVPDEIVTAMVTARLSVKDVKEKGWLLDGYPRSSAQAESLKKFNITPDLFIMLDVPDDILIDRCVGRRLDPLTGKIYHIKNFPPENEEVKARLVTRPDDTEEKVKSRLQIYKQNVDSISSTYLNIMIKIDGNRSKEVVFREIDYLLSRLQQDKEEESKSGKLARNDSQFDKSSSEMRNWRGIPTRLNNIPHSREIRKYFYEDVLQATQRAVKDGKTLLKVEISIPELNPEMDVYRIGTLMELVRTLALSFADDGKRVKVCVQGSMGEGALAGMPLQLAGSRKILEFMDWGNDGAMGTFIKIGSIGGKEVDEQDDILILVAPQNAVGNCIIDDLKAMTDAAGHRPVILVNPRLKDLPGSSGIMQTMGRDKRLEYAASFEICYLFRLLYYAGTQYPIMGALSYMNCFILLKLTRSTTCLTRMSYPYEYELFKRVDESPKKEKYVILSKFAKRPSGEEINDTFEGKTSDKAKKATGI